VSQARSSAETIWDVAIVGGGVAGLVSGVALSDAGYRVVVVERDELGGRARSWTDPVTGDLVDIGPHILLSHYPNMFKMLKRLGTDKDVVWERDQLIKIVEGQTEIIGRLWRIPAPFHFLPSLFADPLLTMRDRLCAVPVGLYAMKMTERDVLALDDVTAYDFLLQQGVTPNHIERFWDPTSLYILNAPVRECSAGALLRFVRYLISHSDYTIGFPGRSLADLYAPAAKAVIEKAGGRVLLRTEVDRFVSGGDTVHALALSGGQQIRARYYISAVPPQNLCELLGDTRDTFASFSRLRGFQPCPYVSVYLWFDRKLTNLKFWARLYKQGDLNSDFYDLSNIRRGWASRPSVIASNIIFSDRLAGMSDDAIIAKTIDELTEFLPGVANARHTHAVVNRIPMAVHWPAPGSEALRAETRTPLRNLFLAGDWTRTGMPASMESASRSGWLAAGAVLEAEQRPANLALEIEPPSMVTSSLIGIARRLPWDAARRWRGRLAEVKHWVKRRSPAKVGDVGDVGGVGPGERQEAARTVVAGTVMESAPAKAIKTA